MRAKLLFVAFKHLAKRLAFTPALPDVWFEVGRGTTLQARATEVLTDYWRATGGKDDPTPRR